MDVSEFERVHGDAAELQQLVDQVNRMATALRTAGAQVVLHMTIPGIDDPVIDMPVPPPEPGADMPRPVPPPEPMLVAYVAVPLLAGRSKPGDTRNTAAWQAMRHQARVNFKKPWPGWT